MWLWFMNLIVNPSSGLLYSNAPPLSLTEQFSFIGNFLIDLLGENDMPVLVVVVKIFFRILYFRGIVRHNDYS